MSGFVITAAGFIVCGLYYLYARWHHHHKWVAASAMFFLPGLSVGYITLLRPSLSWTFIGFAVITTAVIVLTLAAERLERYVRDFRQAGRRFPQEAVAGWLAAFIVTGYAYIQVLAWIDPHGQETTGDFLRFMLVFGALVVVWWLFGKLNAHQKEELQRQPTSGG